MLTLCNSRFFYFYLLFFTTVQKHFYFSFLFTETNNTFKRSVIIDRGAKGHVEKWQGCYFFFFFSLPSVEKLIILLRNFSWHFFCLILHLTPHSSGFIHRYLNKYVYISGCERVGYIYVYIGHTISEWMRKNTREAERQTENIKKKKKRKHERNTYLSTFFVFFLLSLSIIFYVRLTNEKCMSRWWKWVVKYPR